MIIVCSYCVIVFRTNREPLFFMSVNNSCLGLWVVRWFYLAVYLLCSYELCLPDSVNRHSYVVLKNRIISMFTSREWDLKLGRAQFIVPGVTVVESHPPPHPTSVTQLQPHFPSCCGEEGSAKEWVCVVCIIMVVIECVFFECVRVDLGGVLSKESSVQLFVELPTVTSWPVQAKHVKLKVNELLTLCKLHFITSLNISVPVGFETHIYWWQQQSGTIGPSFINLWTTVIWIYSSHNISLWRCEWSWRCAACPLQSFT